MPTGRSHRRYTRRGHSRHLRTFSWHRFLKAHYPAFVTAIVACLLSFGLITALENRLRPVLLTAAQMQTQSMITAVAEEAILAELECRDLEYADLVRVERSETGMITAITTDMAAMNRLRSTLLDVMLEHVSKIDEEAIAIPLGSLIDSELVWGKGPSIKVKTFTIGTASAEFRSEFSSAGVNQTLHKIWLDFSIPTAVLLPGTQIEVNVDTMLCIAETVIVGSVPSYVQRAVG